MKEHVRILTDSAIVINRIAQILDENKIASLVKDDVESARLAGFGIPSNEVQLYVYESDVDEANRIIKSILESN
jgi:coenzyme F420-reducing hydrogenase alpha subunit